MPARLTDRTSWVLAIGLIVVLVAMLATFWLYREQRAANSWVDHTVAVTGALSDLQAKVTSAESGQRGFILTGNTQFLQPYDQARRTLPASVQRLRGMVNDNPEQLARLNRLSTLIRVRLQLLGTGIASKHREAARAPEDFEAGRKASLELGELIGRMRVHEQRLLAQRTAMANTQNQLIGLTLLVTATLLILYGLFALRASRRHLREALHARDALRIANERLMAEAQSREQAEAQLRQVQKMESLGQLTGGIAHDFNNMLAVILGSLEMVRRRLPNNLDQRVGRGIDNAEQGAQRAADLTARLLAFSRRQPLDPKPLDTNRLVSGMSEMLRRTLGDPVQVETVLAGGLWSSIIDAPQLENAILNLCVNARDAMPDGGRLTIETANAFLDDAYAAGHADVSPGQYVMLSVTDTGSGMPADVIQRAFEPFFTTKPVGKGTGLGLSQVYGFIKQSRGHVNIYSEMGTGTTVKLYLPRYYGEGLERLTDAAQNAADLPRAGNGETVLVVEDEENVRAMSVEALSDLGYDIIDCATPYDALSELEGSRRIDLLFTDIMMPGMNGRQLADRAVKIRPDLPVLYTTGYTRNAIVHNGMLDPGVQFLPKPFTFAQLATKVRQVLDGAKAI